ncbi:MAG: hypothetical protein MUE70_09535 [Desulfobacterales bacterium]|jgi:hypothetical protein|nr:hypothetical protein [Desulfobacterales bacterium]
MEYRLNKQTLLEILGQWNGFIKRKIHLIACGGTALTLLDVKPSTKDIDFMVPNEPEYKYLIRILKGLGYQQATGSGWQRKEELFIFDLFPGKRIHTTELMESPLDKGNHTLLKEFSYLYIGVLNDYDLIASKLFRGSNVDFDDCLMLVKAHQDIIDIKRLERHFRELARYDISENRILLNLDSFMNLLKKEKLYG